MNDFKLGALITSCGGLACLFGLSLITSCALYDPSSTQFFDKTCSIPSDQVGTISGQWPDLPIPLAFHSGDFSSTDLLSMTQAAETWNSFYSYSKGRVSLSYGDKSNPTSSNATNSALAANFCSTNVVLGGKFVGNVVVFKNTTWPTSYPPSAIALTSYCTTVGTPYKKIYTALIEFNYQYFFGQGLRNPDLQSVFLHELGHLHGLGHSCENSARAGFPTCSTSIDKEYLAAVMFPSFLFGATGLGESKRSLQLNDQQRANCLY